MNTEDPLRQEWSALRDRLQARHLLQGEGSSLSLRIPGSDAMWFGLVADEQPQRVPLHTPLPQAAVHRQAYAQRADAGAVAVGGGAFGPCLADFGGAMPQVFDEQARHLGPMHPAAGASPALHGRGNVALVAGRPVCLGTTALRLALNAELFEKCAKAYVLAVAGGGRVRPLPWIVRWVANRRLAKDQQRAAARFQQGLLPEESKGY
ncbi:hypothetical protein [Acidovorax sp. M2(2025)]|uniref:hypothetical protein n=1 Tax=Acidovorax sp. M2(2025) TaxID=3411355 RepID=UPI003BF5B284